MKKLMPFTESKHGDAIIGYFFDCPATECPGHAVHVRPYQNELGASWEFNGSLEKPTFSPSLLSRYDLTTGGVKICHSFVRDGKIQFLSDCTHELAGQTVEMLDMEDEE